MVHPPRNLAYLAIFLFFCWLIGFTTFGSIFFDMTNMPSIEKSADVLQKEINAFEKSIRKQMSDNLELLDRLLIRDSKISRLVEDARLQKNKFANDNFIPIVILVFSCNRPTAIRSHLDQIFRLRSSADRFPVIVSQDCDHSETTKTILSYGSKLTLIRQPNQSSIHPPPKLKHFVGYFKIARHYGWALNQIFNQFKYEYSIITEDDLDLAVDFFEYFSATRKLLDLDNTLWCVSSWNDNGKASKISDDASLLHRTDFFPGLGWMLTRRLWTELAPSWPSSFWDDWMRLPQQRKGRACIRPEISRSAMSNNGEVGVSNGLYYEKHLRHIRLNDRFVPFTSMDMTYLLKDRYDLSFVRTVYQCPSVSQDELRSGKLLNGDRLPKTVRLTYDTTNFNLTAKAFDLMDDYKAGVPRTAYRGVVSFMFGKTRVYLAPLASWTNYDHKAR